MGKWLFLSVEALFDDPKRGAAVELVSREIA